jgi:hypothetical protein
VLIKGFQPGSGAVAGFPSVSPSWIAVIGRQETYVYFASQQPITASAREMFINASSRAFCDKLRWRSALREIATGSQKSAGLADCQKRTYKVWSAVRLQAEMLPIVFTSLKSAV